MKKSPLLFALFAGQLALGQVSYRNAQAKPTAKKAYDSTVNFNSIECQFDPASLIGQEVYFAAPNPDFKGSQLEERDTLYQDFFSDRKTSLNSLMDKAFLNEIKNRRGVQYSDPSLPRASAMYNWDKNPQSSAYKPCLVYRANRPYELTFGTPANVLENKTFKIVNFQIEEEGESFCARVFTLQDASGENITWAIRTRYIRPQVSPFIKGFMEKAKQTWINKTVYFRTDPHMPNEYYNPLDQKTYEYVPGSKWKCTELTFLFDEARWGLLNIILQDSAKKEIAVQVDYKGRVGNRLTLGEIWPEETYLAVKKQEKRERDSLLAALKAERMQAEKDRKAMRQQFIKDYGATNGALIADGKVRLGFTREMCAMAWGDPKHKLQSESDGRGMETWLYGWGSWLRFRNDKLVFIID